MKSKGEESEPYAGTAATLDLNVSITPEIQ